jgi:hypothetical protein
VVGVAAGLFGIFALCVLAVLCVVFPPLGLLVLLGLWWMRRDYRRNLAKMSCPAAHVVAYQQYLATLPLPPPPAQTPWHQPVPTCAPPKGDPRPDSISD